MTQAESFDKKIGFFLEHQNAPWSKLRYTIAAANLKRHLPGDVLDILDAGGGNGLEAVAFARAGHCVALVDYSAEMLAEARKNAEKERVGESIEIHQAEVTEIPRLFPPSRFDAALCHSVLQYVEDPEKVLRAIGEVLKPAGILSVICINRYSESFRLALQELDPKAADSALEAKEIVSKVFDAPMAAYAAEDLRAPLRRAGFRVIGEYGIRCVNDYIRNNEIKRDPEFFAELEKLELAMSAKFPYFLLARSFQLVAEKAPA
jgi:S-adenosylmethionine-dependent methyltransferase